VLEIGEVMNVRRAGDDGDATRAGKASANDREIHLLQLVAQGDRHALQELYVAYHRRLGRFLARFSHSYPIAEEIINDTMYVVWRKAADFRGQSQVSTWIMGIAYRRAMKALKRESRASQVPWMPGDDQRPDTAQQNEELHEWIGQALSELSIEQRMVVELTYYLGLSCQEIATIMECPVNTVKTRMFHARRKLRRVLPPDSAFTGGASHE
jgi:RNA polymerase sigma-70 factor (ECF subfamily)